MMATPSSPPVTASLLSRLKAAALTAPAWPGEFGLGPASGGVPDDGGAVLADGDHLFGIVLKAAPWTLPVWPRSTLVTMADARYQIQAVRSSVAVITKRLSGLNPTVQMIPGGRLGPHFLNEVWR
jgi:hypothetical protein